MRLLGMTSLKRLRFNDNVTIIEIPYEDRRNYEFIDKQRFKMRIREFEKLFNKIILNKWRKSVDTVKI